jgi:hypothetical protein
VSRLALEETKFPVAHEAELLDGLDPYDQEDLRRLSPRNTSFPLPA